MTRIIVIVHARNAVSWFLLVAVLTDYFEMFVGLYSLYKLPEYVCGSSR